MRERLTGALTGLDERDRETLLLFAWADLSYDEIAAALEIPVGTVRSRIHRARRTLRSALTRPEPDEAGLAAVGTEKEV